MSKFVYRVENANGEGMYRAAGANLCDIIVDNFENHPLPSNKMASMCWSYGFENPKALYKWLYDSSWIEYLRKNGFRISKYKVTDFYKENDAQCVFLPLKLVGVVGLSIYGPAAFI